jgi:hypothetical protein
MGNRSESGLAICCLLHNLTPGGSAWQWLRLLGKHVEDGGRATIFAPPGPLSAPARRAGIEVVATAPWVEGAGGQPELLAVIAEHDVAVVHWEQGVMEAFGPALEACGRAALALHQAPRGLTRWFGETTVAAARSVLAQAVAERHAVALVRGETHRRKVAAGFGVPTSALWTVPASVALPTPPSPPHPAQALEVLALTRLSPEKAAVVELAVELTAARLVAGEPCRLTLAGEGRWRSEAMLLCERRLPSQAWRIEPAPENPIARLANTDVVVAQGVTTLEAAALGRRVVVARSAGDRGAVVLTPDRYAEAAQDPFGDPPLTVDPDQLWEEALALDEADLRALRQRVETRNSLEVASRALGEALAATRVRSGLRALLRRSFAS